jgi:DNA-directed RNA polymerase specialized sigma24 family protein
MPQGPRVSADDEYTAYAGTRWAGLVRASVLLGCPRHEAEDLVRSVLVRGYRGWEAAWRDDLTDVHIAGLLLAAVRTRARQPPDKTPDDLPDIAYAVDRDARTDLVRVLDLLDDDAREALVLRHVAELTPEQTARVLGVPVATLEHRIAAAYAVIEAFPQETLPCGGEAP